MPGPPILTSSSMTKVSLMDLPRRKLYSNRMSLANLQYVAESSASEVVPEVTLELLDLLAKGHKGLAMQSLLESTEGQSVTFVLRTPPEGVSAAVNHGQDAKNRVDQSMPAES